MHTKTLFDLIVICFTVLRIRSASPHLRFPAPPPPPPDALLDSLNIIFTSSLHDLSKAEQSKRTTRPTESPSTASQSTSPAARKS